MTDTLLTKEEVAARLKCSPKTVQRNRHRLGAVKIGRLLRAWLHQQESDV